MNNTTVLDNVTNTTSIFQRYPGFTALFEEFSPTGTLAERVIPPVWYFVGFVGNPVSAVIWFGRRMRRNNSSAIYLGSLAVSDFVFLLLHLLYHLHTTWGYDIYNVDKGCEPFMFFFYIPQYLSVILVAAFTVERYTAVCHPFLKEKWCTVRRACILVILCVTFSTALASVQIYIWTYQPEYNACNLRSEAAAGGDKSLWAIWNWAVDIPILGVLPLVVLIFNALVLHEIIKLSKNGVITRQQGRGSGGNNTASTLTLLSVSFFLIITQIMATVVTNLQPAFPIGDVMLTDTQVRADPTWTRLFTYMDARKITDVISISHFACYFVIYFLTGKHFRREVFFLATCQGRLHFLDRLVAKTRKGERYSMVSSNGHTLATDTCTTAFTTTM
ncbi:hypothetical protein BaRGS_00039805 [Batillaria attramentaria]|uniref:G-protein coupled receptors family 1 profile domain-containing protein n=1 Tax=Batillaria attramentaria TaxID=370345 RepID=A0ABD0J274_9CAEN|nr:hypothetical protein BaRGS_029321 [Batillaria attramentaria]